MNFSVILHKTNWQDASKVGKIFNYFFRSCRISETTQDISYHMDVYVV